jgi:hypothetical protein
LTTYYAEHASKIAAFSIRIFNSQNLDFCWIKLLKGYVGKIVPNTEKYND